MNLTWGTTWQAMTLLEDGLLLPNLYDLTIMIEFNTADQEKQIVAFDRIKCFIDEGLAGTIFADVNDPLVGMLYKKLETSIITFPEKPIDELIATVLMSKLISITEGNVFFDRLDLSSTLGSDITNSVYSDELGSLTYLHKNRLTELGVKLPWWFRPGFDRTDIVYKGRNKIKVISDQQDWDEFDLTWKPPKKKVEKRGPASIIKMTDWQPRVINGSKPDKERSVGPASHNRG